MSKGSTLSVLPFSLPNQIAVFIFNLNFYFMKTASVWVLISTIPVCGSKGVVCLEIDIKIFRIIFFSFVTIKTTKLYTLTITYTLAIKT